MSKWLKILTATLIASFTLGAVAQAPVEVSTLSTPQPVENDGKIEVLEFFAYGCIHCANLEPALDEWVKRLPADVKFKRVPAAFAIRGIDSVPIFYTLEAMGLQEKLQRKLFDAANIENVILGNPATLNKWLEKQGVDVRQYEDVLKSFSVQTKINRARKMSTDYKIESTPTLVVNGKYLVVQLSGADRLFNNVDRLINEVRQASAKPAAPAAPAKAAPAKAAPAKAAPTEKK